MESMKDRVRVDKTVYHITLSRNPENGFWLAKTDNFLYGSPGDPYFAVKTLIDQLPSVKDDKRIAMNMALIATGAFLASVSSLFGMFVWPIYQLVLYAIIVFILSVSLMLWGALR